MEQKLEKKENTDIADADRYYPLPVWDSVRGYTLMEQFIAILHNPLAREDLRRALASGRGVFRNFKNILKNYPEVERLWFSFKEKAIRHTIIRWYNSLRDAWGLEHIGDEPEETEDIVHDDFIFRDYVSGEDSGNRDAAFEVIEAEIQDIHSGDLGAAFAVMWRNLRSGGSQGTEHALVVETNHGDFSGFASACAFPGASSDTALVTSFFVLPLYRGLGLGSELLDMLVERLNRERFRWIVFSIMLLPPEFIHVLLRRGFNPQRGLYIFDLVGKT